MWNGRYNNESSIRSKKRKPKNLCEFKAKTNSLLSIGTYIKNLHKLKRVGVVTLVRRKGNLAVAGQNNSFNYDCTYLLRSFRRTHVQFRCPYDYFEKFHGFSGTQCIHFGFRLSDQRKIRTMLPTTQSIGFCLCTMHRIRTTITLVQLQWTITKCDEDCSCQLRLGTYCIQIPKLQIALRIRVGYIICNQIFAHWNSEIFEMENEYGDHLCVKFRNII